MEYNILDIINEFWEFYDSIDFVDGIYNEVELTYHKPNLSLLSNILSYSETKKKLYLEYVIFCNDNKTKLRQRHDYDYPNFDIINIHFMQKITSKWENKTNINKKNASYESFKMSHSTEKNNDSMMPLKSNLTNNIDISIVSSASFLIDNSVKVEFKLKGNLGSANSKNLVLVSYLNNVECYKRYSSYYIEFEIVSKTKMLKDKFINNLLKAFQYTFSVNDLSNFYIAKNLQATPVLTYMLPFDKLHLLSKHKYMFTPKIDGEVIHFKVFKGLVTIQLYDQIFKNKTTNIPNNIEMEGIGEYIKIGCEKYIYPFFLKYIRNTGSSDSYNSRYDKLNYYNSIITKKNKSIIFKHKMLINIKYNISKEAIEFYKYIENDTDSNLQDGIVLLDISDEDNLIDYKLKKDNTVDIVGILNTQKGPNVIHKDGMYMNFTLFFYNNKLKQLTELTKTESKSGYLFEYDSQLNLIKFNNTMCRFGKSQWFIPLCCIVEYSFLSKQIINVRLDKTNKLFKQSYYGNSMEVVLESKSYHDKYPALATVGIDYLANILERQEMGYDKQNLLLNKNVPRYFKENTIRTSLNIATNYLKTNAIAIASSNLCSKLPNRYVLSIDSGRGGDLNKYYFMGISGIIATEPDTDARNESIERYKKLQNKSRDKSGVFQFTSLNISILDTDYFSKVKVALEEMNKYKHVGLIDWQLAIHYSYNNDTKCKILKGIKSLVTEGSKVIISCLDGNKLKKDLMNNSNLVFKLSDDIYYYISKVTEDIIKVLYTASMETWLEEYLIFDSIINDFKSYGFVLDDVITFNDVFNENTLSTIEAISQFSRKSTADFYKDIKRLRSDTTQLMQLMDYFKIYIFKYKGYVKS